MSRKPKKPSKAKFEPRPMQQARSHVLPPAHVLPPSPPRTLDEHWADNAQHDVRGPHVPIRGAW